MVVRLDEGRIVFLFKQDMRRINWHRAYGILPCGLIFGQDGPEFRLTKNIHRRWEYVPEARKAFLLERFPSFRCEMRMYEHRKMGWRVTLSSTDMVLLRLMNQPMRWGA